MSNYWVARGIKEYMILAKETDKSSSNTYKTVDVGFDSYEAAQAAADRLNAQVA